MGGAKNMTMLIPMRWRDEQKRKQINQEEQKKEAKSEKELQVEVQLGAHLVAMQCARNYKNP